MPLVSTGISRGEPVHSPFGRLAPPLVRVRLLRLFSKTSSTVWILFSHGPSVGQVLCTVYYGDQSAYNGSINRHIREDAGSVLGSRGIRFGELGSHDCVWLQESVGMRTRRCWL